MNGRALDRAGPWYCLVVRRKREVPIDHKNTGVIRLRAADNLDAAPQVLKHLLINAKNAVGVGADVHGLKQRLLEVVGNPLGNGLTACLGDRCLDVRVPGGRIVASLDAYGSGGIRPNSALLRRQDGSPHAVSGRVARSPTLSSCSACGSGCYRALVGSLRRRCRPVGDWRSTQRPEKFAKVAHSVTLALLLGLIFVL